MANSVKVLELQTYSRDSERLGTLIASGTVSPTQTNELLSSARSQAHEISSFLINGDGSSKGK